MYISNLKKVAPYISLHRICKEAGVSYQSVVGKMKRNTELKEKEIKAIKKVISDVLSNLE